MNEEVEDQPEDEEISRLMEEHDIDEDKAEKVQYWSPELKRVARYFPDFLVETTKGRYLVVEVKNPAERADYEANRRAYKGKPEELTNEVFAKELGFNDFRAANKNFEYRLIFNASLQQEQIKLFEEIQKI